MAEASKTPSQGNTVPAHGDHDRVQMLSLKADGTPDQHNPEVIGDKDVAVAAAKEQFAQQAVSAKDVELRGVSATAGVLQGQKDGSVTVVESTEQDPSIAKLEDEHAKAAKAAESAAESAVNALHKG